jgi:hypothetical protein
MGRHGDDNRFDFMPIGQARDKFGQVSFGLDVNHLSGIEVYIGDNGMKVLVEIRRIR